MTAGAAWPILAAAARPAERNGADPRKMAAEGRGAAAEFARPALIRAPWKKNGKRQECRSCPKSR